MRRREIYNCNLDLFHTSIPKFTLKLEGIKDKEQINKQTEVREDSKTEKDKTKEERKKQEIKS